LLYLQVRNNQNRSENARNLKKFNLDVMTTLKKNVRQNAQILKPGVSASNFKSRSRDFWWSLSLEVLTTSWSRSRRLRSWPITVYTTKKMPHESTRFIRIDFEIFFKWSCICVCHKGVAHFLSSVTAFSELTYKCRYHCELHTTESEMQWFPTFSGLRHPRKEKCNLRHPGGEPIASWFQIWRHFENVFSMIKWKTY